MGSAEKMTSNRMYWSIDLGDGTIMSFTGEEEKTPKGSDVGWGQRHENHTAGSYRSKRIDLISWPMIIGGSCRARAHGKLTGY